MLNYGDHSIVGIYGARYRGARECELCRQPSNTQAHQVGRLSDLSQQGQAQPAWAALMAKMRRKTLMVCPDCHGGIHKER
jgi:hypothetical protein